MDVDFCGARVYSAKHLSAVQAARLRCSDSHLNIDDEGEDEMRAWFPCPFCYVEIEVPVLCSHLQEEHCFDLKNARRRKSQKSGMWSDSSATVGQDLQELTSILGSNPLIVGLMVANHSFSPFLCSTPFSDTKEYKKDVSNSFADSIANADSSTPPFSDAVQEKKDNEGRMQRAAFFQELIASTIF